MRIPLLILFFCAALAGSGMATESMTKVVFRQEGPDVAPGSFGAKPKTLYRWKSTMGRVEQALDADHHLQELFIANGKDGWLINLADKTGTHLVDPSTDNDFYVPIVPAGKPNENPPIRDFQIGRELDFMASQKVASKPVVKDGKTLILYECVKEGYTLDFYVSTSSGSPTESDVSKDGKLLLRLVYLEYSSALDPNPSLFQPPTDVKISEAGPATH